MSKKNWFIEANKSTDSAVKALLEQYNTLDANAPDTEAKRADLKSQIQEKLGLADPAPEKPAEDTAETPAADQSTETPSEPETPSDPEPDSAPADETPSDKPADPAPEKPAANESILKYTESDAAKAKDVATLVKIKKNCRDEIQRLEKTRLKYATYKQTQELNGKIWAVRRIIGIAIKRESALKEREHRARKMSQVSGVAMKRARFVKLLKAGTSITNITKHPEGVKIDELETVLDAATIESCRKHNSKFPEMWERWREKFIVLPARIKSLLAELKQVKPEYEPTGKETVDDLQELVDNAKANKS